VMERFLAEVSSHFDSDSVQTAGADLRPVPGSSGNQRLSILATKFAGSIVGE
jgi:hypothetical protein